MGENKTKEQLLMEMIESQKMLEEKVETQNRMIRKFQTLLQNEGLFSQVIQYFPYPIAVFTRDGVLNTANQKFLAETNRSLKDVAEGKINMHDRLTTENYEILEAVQDIFSGETKLLKNLSDPLSMFVRDDEEKSPANFGGAIFFPLVEDNGQIAYGVVMFI